ncbi:MAG TPA: rhomboid family intramembrane serine protease [Gammaproteobacteria bacterium]|nr:rhomboid family intramembrane serine protease [Gammaproteobacteria bacterium]
MIPLHDDNPTRRPPYITLGIIGLCVAVFLWQLSLGGQGQQVAAFALGAIPAVLFHYKSLPPEIALVPPFATVVTSMFLHGGWLHLIGNMLYLWIFGNNVEDAMGHGRFVVFYLVCGTIAVLAQSLPAPHSTVPMIGASGAISGVLGAYILLYPHARVLVLIPIFFYPLILGLKAGWVLGFWFVMQLLSSLNAPAGQGGVAFGAHVGGFVAGMALVALFKRRGVPLLRPPRGQPPSRW